MQGCVGMVPAIISVAIGMVIAEIFATIMPGGVMPQEQPIICLNFRFVKFGMEAATGHWSLALSIQGLTKTHKGNKLHRQESLVPKN